MATDPGVRDTYLTRIQREIENRRDKLGKNLAEQQIAALEDAAQATLSSADNTLLLNAGFVDRTDLSQLQAEERRLRSTIQALRDLRDAVKAVA